MTKKNIKTITNNGCKFYGINGITFYIKGDKIEGQINIKKLGTDIYSVDGKISSGADIVALTK